LFTSLSQPPGYIPRSLRSAGVRHDRYIPWVAPLQPTGLATASIACHNVDVADKKPQKNRYVDNGWPAGGDDDHAVSELAADRTGALSPFGEVTFPLPADELPYTHPVTVINR
jgi:hypothetical protein